MTHFLSGKKIFVSGAGIGGLAFVIALRKNWDDASPFPEVVVYNSDDKETSINKEIYSMSLGGADEWGGLVAIRDLGLLDKVLERALLVAPKGQGFTLWDNKWSSLLTSAPPPFEDLPSPSVRIKRPQLVTVLVEAAEAAAKIEWGTAVTSVEQLGDGRVRVSLSNGTLEEGDLLIAADGANSQIRKTLRPKDDLEYAGAVHLGGVALFKDGVIPSPIDKSWGLIITGSEAGCFFSPVDKDRAVWALSKWEKGTPRDGYDNKNPQAFEALKAEALKLGKTMDEPFATLVNNTLPETSFTTPARDKQPFAHDSSLKGVIFIGDSNHMVSSFAGNGGNMALKDAWDLSKALVAGKSAEEAVSAYDAVFLPRAQKNYKDSRDRMAQSHYSGFKWTMFKGALKAGGAIMSAAGK